MDRLISNTSKGDSARKPLIAGALATVNAVKITLGAAGRNAILSKEEYPFHAVTNDGVSIAKDIHFLDPYHEMGANIIREVADRADKESGDGTTTATVLIGAILEEAEKENIFGMELKRSLDECVSIIEASVDKQKRIVPIGQLHQAASVAAEDEEIGKILQDIYTKIGPAGIVEVEPSGTQETSWEAKEGVRMRNCGFMAPYMPNEGGKAVYKKPKVLVTKQRISTLNDIDPLFAELSRAGIHELVMVVEDIVPEVLQPLSYTHGKGIFKTLIIKAPMLWKDWMFEDFAALTGATVIGLESGIPLGKAKMEHLGTCEKLVSSKDETTIIGPKDISGHVARIKDIGGDGHDLRISWLTTKAAVLRLGANSESELFYRTKKAEDARNAAQLALQDGIVAGGGVALMNASFEMPDTIGGRILRKALRAPAIQIMENAGRTGSTREGFDTNRPLEYLGFNAKTGMLTDMFSEGIVDPAKVTKNSVRNAVSIASTILTAEVVIIPWKKV